ncbi:MAG TPA: TauD/TfdA family dioxygenase [Micromonosporaceae bacterium]|nr:TauD/TfdA family dioxygenase [Micromonosporaceae bacterium]
MDFAGDQSGAITDESFRRALLDGVRDTGVVVVHGFPRDGGALVRFGREFGELEPADPFKENLDHDDPMDWLGHVAAHKKKTWGSRLALHTAAAHAPVEPRLHIMLMLDRGIVSDDPTADNGQSLLGRVDDAVDKLVANLGDQAEPILQLLQTTPVSTGFPFPDVPRTEPILVRRDDGSWRFRYWIRILQYAADGGLSADQLDALERFDEALNATSFDVALDSGDLIVIDNHRLAHGRRPFQTATVDESGQSHPTTRRIYNVHVFRDEL